LATYAIGDIQGCFSALQKLAEQIRFDPARDKLWFVGDLVNRGPDSVSVLRWVKGLGERAVVVLGNHDLHVLAVAEGVVKPRRKDTVQEILAAPDRDELLVWLRGRRMLHVENGFVLVHAGLLPQWTVSRAGELAREVEQALRGEEYRTFLKRYRDDEPRRWSDELAGTTRLCVIANVLTRLRFCAADGTMEFSHTGPPESPPQGFLPWFQIPDRKSAEVTVICGHWAALGARIQDSLVALDSGCVWGGRLTAVRLEDRQAFQVSCSGQAS
jgi:bis(5'-nucleosyl)-tetraphosphatase (symmetrical)